MGQCRLKTIELRCSRIPKRLTDTLCYVSTSLILIYDYDYLTCF